MNTPEFIQLLTTSQSRLYGYILSLVLDPDQADDILQQTNTVLWEKKDKFEIGTNFIAWSFRIAYFQVLAHRKNRQRDRLVFDDGMLREISEVSVQSDETFEERQRLMRECLEKLDHRKRKFIRLRYSAGSTLKQIAIDTDSSVTNVKQILFRARASLTECIRARLLERGSA
ncbi:MAG: sigma-70 family RNA polymerase sigma factor [Planctomycetota bacterium]